MPDKKSLHELTFKMTPAERMKHYRVYIAYQNLEAAMDACDYYKHWGGPVFQDQLQCLESESLILHSVYQDDPRYAEPPVTTVKRVRKPAPPSRWKEGATGVFTLAVHEIWLNPDLNLRQGFDPKRHKYDRELTESVREHGILVPVVVRRKVNKAGKRYGIFELAQGYRRVMASMFARSALHIPCVEETEATKDVTS